MLVLLSAAALIWMLNRMPKKTGADLYVWYFIMIVIGAVLFVSILRLLGFPTTFSLRAPLERIYAVAAASLIAAISSL